MQSEIFDEQEYISLLFQNQPERLYEKIDPEDMPYDINEHTIEFECFDHINPTGYSKLDMRDIEDIQSRLEKLEN